MLAAGGSVRASGELHTTRPLIVCSTLRPPEGYVTDADTCCRVDWVSGGKQTSGWEQGGLPLPSRRPALLTGLHPAALVWQLALDDWGTQPTHAEVLTGCFCAPVPGRLTAATRAVLTAAASGKG